jgi:hypothetical protein
MSIAIPLHAAMRYNGAYTNVKKGIMLYANFQSGIAPVNIFCVAPFVRAVRRGRNLADIVSATSVSTNIVSATSYFTDTDIPILSASFGFADADTDMVKSCRYRHRQQPYRYILVKPPKTQWEKKLGRKSDDTKPCVSRRDFATW